VRIISPCYSLGTMASPEPLLPAYLIVGTDRPKVRYAVQRLRRRVIRDGGSDLNVLAFEIDSARTADSLQEVLDATWAPSLALGTRLILVQKADKLRAAQRKQLAAYLDDPMPDTCIAFEAEKLGKDDALFKAVTKAGSVLRFDLPKKWEMARWVCGRAKENRMHMSRQVAEHLLARCGADPSRAEQIERELEKLAIYCRGEEPTEADVDAICSPDDDTVIFDLMDAVGHRDRGRSFVLLESLYASGNPRNDANGVLYSLKRHIEQLDAALQLSHADQSTAAKQLGVHPFAAKKLLVQREHFDRRRIGRAYRALAEAEAGLRGRAPVTLESIGGVNDADRLVVELALARMLA
jgi:DNA polymerase III subunit delta